ncbi:biotin--[acetyl-CoA-carboxylase] ligase [Subsaxibacter sp. CAU 1640]|uniref:biotin--[acetyl-CoA-carboxylase] ligase n=1 Tax=Subsaxibacter sp. CAU 1640 TaxID=2933271 RepID=UPI0020067E14|nr:biotin--[acetyl-CoA-carboxylase] ligase [Subsaxibacter sp. CAU 1640]MCK7591993.1 biotin--[acetyl-CoA-carboxylase] ligase [Subsaxibacter sp. CAU 1640]
MRIIKLNAIDSTNSYLRRLSTEEMLEDYTIVTADHQTDGRGQMGTNWASQEGKNLTVSVFKDVSFLKIEHSFYISISVSLAVFKALEMFQIRRLKIKWPNDILSENKKIAGILIENVIKQNQLQASVIGLGLNVNQTEFEGLPNASSLLLISGKVLDLDEVLNEILKQLHIYFQKLENGYLKKLKQEYENQLFRKGKPSTFMNMHGEFFTGIILGISDSGNLKLQTEKDEELEFDLKEISLIY